MASSVNRYSPINPTHLQQHDQPVQSSSNIYPGLSSPTGHSNLPSAPQFDNPVNCSPPAPGFVGGRAQMPTSKIELTISCRNLLNRDIISKSDPYCLVLMKDSWQKQFYEIGRTETIQDNLSPEWVKKFIIDYNFEIVQKIRFEIWDQDPDSKDFLGYYQTTLGEIVSFSSQQYVRPLTLFGGKKQSGEIVIVTEELSSCKQIVQMQFAAENLPRSFCALFRSDQFLVISRSNEDGTFSVVIKTEPVHPSKSITWKPITIRVRTLCNGDYDRTIKVDCYDAHSNGKHVLLGTCFTSLRELVGAGSEPTATAHHSNLNSSKESKKFQFEPAQSQQKSKKSSTDSSKPGALGTLVLCEIVVTDEITFLDYIKSGTQMHFAVAIDFTASNGPPNDPHSLHFLDPNGRKPNAYVTALRAVGEIIQQYDSAGMYPAFGFGARLPPNGVISHQFPLNFNFSHPYCSGISEILTHYQNCLSMVTLYGPTNFSLVIQNTASIASKYQDGKHYFILLIITDGIISDMRQTKNAIIEASPLPISIIIVGVGNADFSAMNELDSDGKRLSVNGRFAERDIVQFVALNKFLSRNGPSIFSQADLARDVLAEIPDQVTGFMKKRGFSPIATAS